MRPPPEPDSGPSTGSGRSFDPGVILEALLSYGVDFVLIGGIARVAHGSSYPTYDLDIAYHRGPPNLARLADALRALGATLRGAPSSLPWQLDAQALSGVGILTLQTRHGPLDLLADPPGAGPYERLRGSALAVTIEAQGVLVASLDDLISMSRAIGREKDRTAIDELVAIDEEARAVSEDDASRQRDDEGL